jgi:hypothetical protein
VIQLNLPQLRIDRDDFIRRLKERQIGTNVDVGVIARTILAIALSRSPKAR